MERNEERLRLSIFLRDKGCYNKFMKNFFNQNRFSNLDELCNKHHHKNIIEQAFNWAGTPEGVGFWQRLSVLWAASHPAEIELKDDIFYLLYQVGEIIEDKEHGLLRVEASDGMCRGCVFNVVGDCKNKKYGCSPYSRGDAIHVIFNKL